MPKDAPGSSSRVPPTPPPFKRQRLDNKENPGTPRPKEKFMSTFSPVIPSKPTPPTPMATISRARAAGNARAFKQFMSKPNPRSNNSPASTKPLKVLVDPATLRSKPLSEKSNANGPQHAPRLAPVPPAIHHLPVPPRPLPTPRRPSISAVATPTRPMVSLGGRMPFPLSGPRSNAATTTPSGKMLVTPLTTRLAQILVPDNVSSPSGVDPLPVRGLLFASFAESDTTEDLEMNRGLLQSPRKGDTWKGKGTFMRDGMAERAAHIIERSQNAFSLWHLEASRNFTITTSPRLPDPSTETTPVKMKPPAALPAIIRSAAPTKDASSSMFTPKRPKSSISLAADKRFRIVRIIAKRDGGGPLPAIMASKPKSRITSGYVLAECSVVRKKTQSVDGVESITEDLNSSVKTESVLFSSVKGGGGRVGSIEGMEVGKQVLVWKPWIKTGEEGQGEETKGSTTLLCTRFVVLP